MYENHTIAGSDVARVIDRLRSEGRSLRHIVNEALRIGLRDMTQPEAETSPFETGTAALGPKLPNVDDVSEVLAIAEGENYR